jgi:hypothetical protein
MRYKATVSRAKKSGDLVPLFSDHYLGCSRCFPFSLSNYDQLEKLCPEGQLMMKRYKELWDEETLVYQATNKPKEEKK